MAELRPGRLLRAVALAVLASLPSCAAIDASSRDRSPRSEPAGPPADHEMANASYDGIHGVPVLLADGAWEGEPFVAGGAARPRVELVRGFRPTGDLDGDGTPEAVVLLAASSGGSGTFAHLAAMGRWDGRVVNLGTAPVGDRVQVQAGEIAAGRVTLDVVQAGPEDAACCPGEKRRRVWELRPEGLVEISSEQRGRLRVADLAGVEWVLTHFRWDEEAPAAPEITLVFRDDSVSGRAGCNRIEATVGEGEGPGELGFGVILTTRMACEEPVMEIEARFLRALGTVDRFAFHAGQLGLSWMDGDERRTMIFRRRPLSD